MKLEENVIILGKVLVIDEISLECINLFCQFIKYRLNEIIQYSADHNLFTEKQYNQIIELI